MYLERGSQASRVRRTPCEISPEEILQPVTLEKSPQPNQHGGWNPPSCGSRGELFLKWFWGKPSFQKKQQSNLSNTRRATATALDKQLQGPRCRTASRPPRADPQTPACRSAAEKVEMTSRAENWSGSHPLLPPQNPKPIQLET